MKALLTACTNSGRGATCQRGVNVQLKTSQPKLNCHRLIRVNYTVGGFDGVGGGVEVYHDKQHSGDGEHNDTVEL